MIFSKSPATYVCSQRCIVFFFKKKKAARKKLAHVQLLFKKSCFFFWQALQPSTASDPYDHRLGWRLSMLQCITVILCSQNCAEGQFNVLLV